MSSAMDLDRSLDDIIKKRKDKNQRKQPKPQPKAKQQGNRGGSGRTRQGGSSFPNNNNNNNGGGGRRGGNKNPLSVSSKSKTIGKSAKGNNNITSRRGGGGGQMQLQKQQQQRQKNTASALSSSSSTIDPSSIVITKKVSRNNSNGNNNYISNNNHNNGNRNNRNINNGRMNPFIPTGPAAEARGPSAGPVTQRGLSIRGASYGAASSSMFANGSDGFNIRGESGPAIVLISNLDPGANADDIRMICAQFGQVSHCEVAVDQTGRSFGEAEVEFVQKQSALDCINKLDNEVADGRIVRAILRSRPSGMSGGYMNQSVRSVIAPSRSGFTSA
ncbi:hypothetical protein BDB00DRAFT_847588 [Zychaea mexicana]|uniref:uncharacterized protein n=1 Tax=Zychaea mexicana TaxID=64656 RepID=UPI0022FE61A6|nr:uncharacterized protein BDB00DRAFT_847588 [Zychaea mexicana]KAI9488613.1 hypothetical protein BDB00DRAFT_847588 [Zychaea mexicana]